MKGTPTVSEKVHEYIRANPRCSARAISDATGTTIDYAGLVARRLEYRGLVETDKKNGRLCFSAVTSVENNRTIRRARELGGHFGILAAQVMA